MTIKAIGRIGDSLPALWKWAKPYQAKGMVASVVPLGNRWQLTLTLAEREGRNVDFPHPTEDR